MNDVDPKMEKVMRQISSSVGDWVNCYAALAYKQFHKPPTIQDDDIECVQILVDDKLWGCVHLKVEWVDDIFVAGIAAHLSDWAREFIEHDPFERAVPRTQVHIIGGEHGE